MHLNMQVSVKRSTSFLMTVIYVNPIVRYMRVSVERSPLQHGRIFRWLEYMLTLFYAICRFLVNSPFSNMAEFSADWNIC